MTASSIPAVAETTVSLEGDLTAAQVSALRLQIKGVIAGGVLALVVDLTRCVMVDSSGIGLLVATYNSLKKLGGTLTIVGASKDLRELFRTMRLQQHFRIAD